MDKTKEWRWVRYKKKDEQEKMSSWRINIETDKKKSNV